MAAINISNDLKSLYTLNFSKVFCEHSHESEGIPAEEIGKEFYLEAAPLYLQSEILQDCIKNKNFESIDDIIKQFNKLFNVMKAWCSENGFTAGQASEWSVMQGKFKDVVLLFKDNNQNQSAANIILKALGETKKQFESVCYQLTKMGDAQTSYKKQCIQRFIADGRLSNCVQGFLVDLKALNLNISGSQEIAVSISATKLKTLIQLAAGFIQEKKLNIGEAFHIHYVTTFVNSIAEQYGVEINLDGYSNDKYKLLYPEFANYVQQNFTACFINTFTNYLMQLAGNIKDNDSLKINLSEDYEQVTVKTSVAEPLLSFSIIKRFASKEYFTNNKLVECINVGQGQLILIKNMISYSMFFERDETTSIPIFNKLYSEEKGYDSKLFESFQRMNSNLGRVLLAGLLKHAIYHNLDLQPLIKYCKEMDFELAFLKDIFLYALAKDNLKAARELNELGYSIVQALELDKIYTRMDSFKLQDYVLDSVIEEQAWPKMELLLKISYNKDILGRALLNAANSNRTNICQILIEKGASFCWSFTSGLSKGYYAVHCFIYFNNMKLLESALLKGASPNVRHDKGILPVQLAIDRNNSDAVNLLTLGESFDGDAKLYVNEEEIGYRLLSYALIYRERSQIAKTYLSRFSSVVRGKLLVDICSHNQFEHLGTVLLYKPNFGWYSSKRKYAALHYAIKYQNHKALKLLIDANAPLNFSADDGITPLELALKKDDIKSIKILLQAGASISKSSNPLYPTPLRKISHKHYGQEILKFYSELLLAERSGLRKVILMLCSVNELGLLKKYLQNDKVKKSAVELALTIDFSVDNYNEAIKYLIPDVASLTERVLGNISLLLYTAQRSSWQHLKYMLSLLEAEGCDETLSKVIQLEAVMKICKAKSQRELVAHINRIKPRKQKSTKLLKYLKKRGPVL